MICAAWHMNKNPLLLWSVLISLSLVSSVSCDVEIRKLKTEINPGCTSVLAADCQKWTNLSLIHVKSDSDKDSLHFIWSFNGSPSLLLARTPLDSTLNVRWNALQHNSTNDSAPVISFNGSHPFYTFGWSISNVWIFDDPSDKVHIDRVNQTTQVHNFHTKDFTWERTINNMSESLAKLTFFSNSYSNHALGPDGFFQISITMRNSDGYSDILPYMLHNSNNSQVDIAFNKVQMDFPERNPNATRVGFGFTFVQEQDYEEQVTDLMTLDKLKTLDDEHSPGVFEMYRIRAPAIGPNRDESYLEWKAICYTDFIRNIANSVDVHSYSMSNEAEFNSTTTQEAVNSSILMLYYGGRNFSAEQAQLLVQYANITFGTEGDGWYNHTPDLSWTFVTGYGAPPFDYVSLLVILVLSVGLGIPALLILGAGIYILMKRLAKPTDDLLLER